MNQSKIDSKLEALTNVLIGAIISFLFQLFWFPVIGKEFTAIENLITTIFFTSISVIRSYSIRRWFNDKSVYRWIKEWLLKLNPLTHGFQSVSELQMIGLARSAKQNMKKALKGFIVAIYFQGVTVLSDGAKITYRRFVLAATIGLAVILLILVFG